MDDRVRALKQLFPNEVVCCFACGMKKMNLRGDFLVFLMARNCTVADLTVNPPADLQAKMQTLSPAERVSLEVVRQAVMDGHAPNPPPLVHRRYYQREEVDAKYDFNNSKILIGKIVRGKILQIYRKSENCVITSSVVDNLTKDFLDCFVKAGHYRDLPAVKSDQYIKLDFKTGDIEIGTTRLGSVCVTSVKQGYWKDLSVESQIREFKAVMGTLDRLSLIIVGNMRSSRSLHTIVRQWVDLLTASAGGMRDIIVVFVVSYDEFAADQVATKKEARRMINLGMPPQMQQNALWLDTSSVNNLIAASEEGKVIDLNLRRLTDGGI